MMFMFDATIVAAGALAVFAVIKLIATAVRRW